jgi:hypothetical protein
MPDTTGRVVARHHDDVRHGTDERGVIRSIPMSDKPSYLGLLNAVSVAESDAGTYLSAWAAVTPSEEVRAVISTVALREAEHGLAFAKRIDELGYDVIKKDDPKSAERVAIAGSTTLSDKEKFEAFGLGVRQNGGRDVFDSFFENKDLDPVTGALLGRYIAEERDSGRKLAACYALLCEADAATNGKKNGGKGSSKSKQQGGKGKGKKIKGKK